MNNNEIPPPMPARPQDQHEVPPAMPPRPQSQQPPAPYNPQDYQNIPMGTNQDPTRLSLEQHDISSPIHFVRDPHKLIGYLVPFPKPTIPSLSPDQIPQRFLIYTPPPPPFMAAPKEGEKESKVHKVQRKWLEEVRTAKTSNVKTMSWKGLKGKATKGISWGMSQTKSSSLEFLNRIGENEDASSTPHDKHHEDGHAEDDQTKGTVKLEEMLLIYPSTMPGTNETIRKEFVETMLRSKSKAERDAVIATGLLPVSFALDMLMVLVWPFGGLLEIDAVWLYSSVRGAKTSRSVTKRLSSTSTSGDHDKDKLHLNFTPSPQLDVLERYLAAKCHERDPKLFPQYAVAPGESEVLEAIGWFPSGGKGGVEGGKDGEQEVRNWEDEQWEIMEVKDDLKSTMGKGAKEWGKWCRLFEEKPEKAVKR